MNILNYTLCYFSDSENWRQSGQWNGHEFTTMNTIFAEEQRNNRAVLTLWCCKLQSAHRESHIRHCR